jgi:WD40 repeat protein
VTAGKDAKVILSDIRTGQEIRQFTGHRSWVNTVQFSRDARYLLTASDDGTARLWNVQTGQEIREFSSPTGINSAVFSPDGEHIAVGSTETIAIWSIDSTDKPEASLPTLAALMQLVFSPDGQYILFGDTDGNVRVWDWRTDRIVWMLPNPSGIQAVCDISPDGHLVGIGTADGLLLWETQRLF